MMSLKIRIISGLILVAMCSSCSLNEKQNNADEPLLNIDRFVTYQIDIHKEPTSFFSLIEEVEVVRLEETSESLLSSVRQLHFIEDKGLIVFPGRKGDIYIYSDKGTFIRKINKMGGGPEEYRSISEYWIDEGVLNIYDSNSKRIQQYSLSGDYLLTIEVLYSGDFICPMPDGGYVVDMNLKSEDTLNFNLVTLDDKLKKVDAFSPFKKEKFPKKVYTYSKSLTPFKGGVVYHKNMTDTVFYLNHKSLNPLFTYDFGRDWVWNKEHIVSNPVAIRETTMNNELVWRTISRVGEDNIFLRFIGGSKQFKYVLIDRLTKEVDLLDLRKDSGGDYGVSPIRWYGNYFICSLRATDFNDFQNELKEGQLTFREGTTIQKIESSENPILVWIKFK